MSLHGGNIYDFPGAEEIIDFSSNINPYGPPACALSAAAAALSVINRYPDSEQRALKHSFASWFGIPSENFVFGNGASELISALLFTLRPGRLITVVPTFLGYSACAVNLGISAIEIPAEPDSDFAFPIEQIKRTFREGDIIIACQPNNPTGRAWTGEELMELAEMCRGRGWLIVDECFVTLSYPAVFSSVSMIDDGSVIVLRALTKDFSAPGLRMGFVIAKSSIVTALRSRLQSWPINSVGEAFAAACAREPEPFLSESAKKIADERVRLMTALRSRGYHPFPTAANYILARSSHIDARELQAKLLEHSILIRACGNFASLDDSYFRIAVRNRVDNDKFISSIAMI